MLKSLTNIFSAFTLTKHKQSIKDEKIKNVKITKFVPYDIIGYNNKIIITENGVQRELKEQEKIDGLDIKINGNNNKIYIPDTENFSNSIISINSSNSTVSFGNKFSNLKSINNIVAIIRNGDNQILNIGDRVLIWGATFFLDEKNSGLCIGEDSLLSSDITIWTADGHPIFDINNKRINNVSHPVYIGKHTWIGQGVRITKNAAIPPNCIVGGGSVVSKSFNQENSIIVGNPAKIIKTGVYWKHT